MFGEYMVYVNDKPIFIVCDNTVYVKKHDVLKEIMKNAESGFPYDGSKEHYIVEIDNFELSRRIVDVVEPITSIPKKKKKKTK
jgi:TfoX/Sxy family transcriptional regulator of competence genes